MRRRRDEHLLYILRWSDPMLIGVDKYERVAKCAEILGNKLQKGSPNSKIVLFPPLPKAKEAFNMPVTVVSELTDGSSFITGHPSQIMAVNEDESLPTAALDDSDDLVAEEACLDLLSDLAISEVTDNVVEVSGGAEAVNPARSDETGLCFRSGLMVNHF